MLNGTGLSPLARGTLPLVSCRPRKNRFIPAGAGNSSTYAPSGSAIPVYPRWRGKLPLRLMNDNKNGGLSPLARGTRCCLYRTLRESRFIPAGAGNSATRWQSSYPTTVYPRWRGELLIRSSYSAPLAGLSPLARGTQHGRPYEIPVARFIPAGAGNSHPSRNNAFIFPVYPRWRGEL